MTWQKVAFTQLACLRRYNRKTEAEPKRNISCVAENDFSPKRLQVGNREPPEDVHCKVSASMDAYDLFRGEMCSFSHWEGSAIGAMK
jgi:hypothetical protein